MAEQSGRDFTISKASTVLAGGREVGMSVDNSPVNVTDQGDSGYRSLAGFSGERTLDMSFSGVWNDDTLRDLALGAEGSLLMTDITIDFSDGGSLSGDFFLQNYEETGPYDNSVTFTATLQSSDAWTYTAAV